jgi:hypothetical protein
MGRDIAERIEWVEGDLAVWTPRRNHFDLVVCLYVHVAGSVDEMVRRMATGVAAVPDRPLRLYERRAFERRLPGVSTNFEQFDTRTSWHPVERTPAGATHQSPLRKGGDPNDIRVGKRLVVARAFTARVLRLSSGEAGFLRTGHRASALPVHSTAPRCSVGKLSMTRADPLIRCDECRSPFTSDSSRMAALCPECSHWLYGYPNCTHEMVGGECRTCRWDGSVTPFVQCVKDEAEASLR